MISQMSFIYADDICITAQNFTFSQVENTVEEVLGELTTYNKNNNTLLSHRCALDDLPKLYIVVEMESLASVKLNNLISATSDEIHDVIASCLNKSCQLDNFTNKYDKIY